MHPIIYQQKQQHTSAQPITPQARLAWWAVKAYHINIDLLLLLIIILILCAFCTTGGNPARVLLMAYCYSSSAECSQSYVHIVIPFDSFVPVTSSIFPMAVELFIKMCWGFRPRTGIAHRPRRADSPMACDRSRYHLFHQPGKAAYTDTPRRAY
ncbi:hypothetical protein F4775DRAFT_493868 [Biscogniauxia sp. FL1348]|nr:hypothetical protein F4775DRAFT_493868 [Biscogniauxia sp. FL1348]